MVDKPVETLPSAREDSTALLDGGGDPGAVERTLAAVLASVVRTEHVPVDSHFFDDLGADSLVRAHFCARVRKRGDLPSVSMKDVYRHPAIRSLATALTDDPPAVAPAVESAAVPPAPVRSQAGVRQYVLCGALQLVAFLGYFYVIAFGTAVGYEWISAGSGVLGTYSRSVVFGGVAFAGLCAFPVLAKWTLVGRWKPRQIPIWSLSYVRFWIVKTLVRSDPLVLFSGSPLYLLYLRALGAKVGRGERVLSRQVPVCTDLLTIGDGTVVRKDSLFACYRAHASVIQTGPVTLGRNVLVSEATVLDIDTSMGDGAQLGHATAANPSPPGPCPPPDGVLRASPCA
ncbi:phosphopantetheine-binding protein [Streptomyces chartreusis]